MGVPLLDLKAHHEPIHKEVMAALERAFTSQAFILGPDVSTLEKRVAAYCETKNGIGVSSGTDALLLALMAFAFILLVTGLVARPPSSMMASGAPEAHGVTRITRHPTFAAIFLFGIAHCLVNGHLSDLIFFGGFSLFAWIGAVHQDSRKVVEVAGYAEFKNETSFIPFGAMLSGKQQLDLREFRLPIVLLALVVFYIVRAYHPQLFGGVLMTL